VQHGAHSALNGSPASYAGRYQRGPGTFGSVYQARLSCIMYLVYSPNGIPINYTHKILYRFIFHRFCTSKLPKWTDCLFEAPDFPGGASATPHAESLPQILEHKPVITVVFGQKVANFMRWQRPLCAARDRRILGQACPRE